MSNHHSIDSDDQQPLTDFLDGGSAHAAAAQGIDERRAFFIRQIQAYIERQRNAVLSQTEIAGKNGEEGRRLKLLGKFLLLAAARYYRAYPRADASLGVVMLITVMSDNAQGRCTLSFERMGRFLSRDYRNVSRAAYRAKDGGLIGIVERPGSSPICWPLIDPALLTANISAVWLIDALAPVGPIKPRGSRKHGEVRPSHSPSVDTTPVDDSPDVDVPCVGDSEDTDVTLVKRQPGHRRPTAPTSTLPNISHQ